MYRSSNLNYIILFDIWQIKLTRMPHILNPYIGTGGKKQPMDWYKEETNHVACQCNANEEY